MSNEQEQRAALEAAISAIGLLMESVVVANPRLQKIDFSKPSAENARLTEVHERHVKAMLVGEHARNTLLKLVD